jgi:predicted phage terminase large subunit-like protein
VPALNDKGESNFDYKYGVGFDTEYFLDMRDTLDDASFRALYMNEPIEREGLLFHKDELRRYFELPDREPDAIYAVCDTKDKGEDYAVCPVAYQYGNDYYIVDAVCDNNKPEVVEPRIENLLVKHKPHLAQFESNAAGGRVAKDIQEHIKARGCRTKITTKYTTANKETKIITNSPFIKDRFLFQDESMYEAKSDYGKMVNMLCSYTMAGKNKHDDAPDALSMLSIFVQNINVPKVEVVQRPF